MISSGDAALGQERIHGGHGAIQGTVGQEALNRFDLMTLARDIFLAQGVRAAVAHQADQAMRLAVGIGAPQFFAVDRLPLQPGTVSRPHLARWGIVGVQRLIMTGDLRFDSGLVDLFEHAPQGRRTG